MPPKRKANATKKGDASESTARRQSPDPPADSASAQSPERQPGVADTVSEKPASGAGAATNNEDAAVGTAGVPDHSQVMKRKPGRVAKRGRAAANAPKDPAEQTPEIPNRSEPAGADVDGPTVTTEPPVKTAGKRGLAALGPPAKRAAAAANASEPEQEFASPNHSNTSDGDATDGPTVAAEQRPAKAVKRGRAAARKVAEPHALSAHGQGAAVDAVSPVRSPSTHSEPPAAPAEDGKRAETSKSTGKQAAKRGRPAKSIAATAVPQQQVHDMSAEPQSQALATHDQHADIHEAKTEGERTSGSPLPADASNPGEDSGSQNPLLPKKRSLGLSKQPVLMANGNTDVSDVAAKNSLAKGTKRGRASGTIEAAASESRELGEQGPPAKRATVSASSFYGTTSGTTAQGAKRAGRPAKQPPPAAVPSTSSPGTAAATDGHSGRVAKKASTKAQPAAAKGPGKQNKKQPAKGETAASNGTGKQKKVAKGRQQPKSKQGKRKDADDLSDVSDSSYVVPRGLLQRAKRREPFYYDYIVPWVESQLPSESDDEDDFSTASLSSIIPPAGVLQPYRSKNRLIGAGGSGSSSEDDMSVSPGEDLLSRCEAKFGVGTLPHSTTTTAEAISMLVNFVSSRHLPFRDLAELVTISNKLFAPAEDVLPTGKALAKALSEMP
ncbi:hypothetical protein HPB50_013357 [Hyalomma asiaticum]|uniref:Uncharacterized protein n=1 Tax=Hyalomma asiaticum TaxID=266040 RepID=A0ACB7T4R8_HYAAI|nr:hypothetical protein HPB50_013357 [Hyalomma asiaticum]